MQCNLLGPLAGVTCDLNEPSVSGCLAVIITNTQANEVQAQPANLRKELGEGMWQCFFFSSTDLKEKSQSPLVRTCQFKMALLFVRQFDISQQWHLKTYVYLQIILKLRRC